MENRLVNKSFDYNNHLIVQVLTSIILYHYQSSITNNEQIGKHLCYVVGVIIHSVYLQLDHMSSRGAGSNREPSHTKTIQLCNF